MNPLKCAFRMSTRKFLRFLVHSRGIDVDPAKAMAIATKKPSTTVKELKNFLGKVSYIKRFIPSLASITLAFTKLLKKGQDFEWGRNKANSFPKAIRDYDEPPHSANLSPQETVAALPSLKLICHLGFDSLGGRRRH